jgi:tyrosine-protein kinase Etk/Wzc
MEPKPGPEGTVTPGGGLVDLALLAARRKGLLLTGTLVGTIVMLAVSLALPKWFQAEIRMVAPKKSGLGGGLMMPGGGGGGLAALDLLSAVSGGGTEPNLLASLIQSRTVTDAVIGKFGLQKRYDQQTIEETRMALWGHAAVDIERKSGVISLKVEDKSPGVARDIATALADEANRLNNRISSTRAGQERKFLEGRVVEAQRDLAAAEVALKEFSVKHKMLDVREQTRASIQAVARIRGEIQARDVMLSYLTSFSGEGEENQSRLRREVAALKKQLENLESGAAPAGAKGSPKGGNSSSVVTPITELPELGLEYTRLFRNLKILETVFELLTKQHELAKLAEASDTANAQVIDAATVPTRKVRPKRAYYVVFGFLTGLIVCFVLARFLERLDHDPVAAARWRAVREALRSKRARRG